MICTHSAIPPSKSPSLGLLLWATWSSVKRKKTTSKIWSSLLSRRKTRRTSWPSQSRCSLSKRRLLRRCRLMMKKGRKTHSWFWDQDSYLTVTWFSLQLACSLFSLCLFAHYFTYTPSMTTCWNPLSSLIFPLANWVTHQLNAWPSNSACRNSQWPVPTVRLARSTLSGQLQMTRCRLTRVNSSREWLRVQNTFQTQFTEDSKQQSGPQSTWSTLPLVICMDKLESPTPICLSSVKIRIHSSMFSTLASNQVNSSQKKELLLFS